MDAIFVVGAAISRAGRCLVAQRGPGRAFAGMWEFPGGKVEAGESPEQALVREIQEELGLVIAVAEQLGRGHASHGAGRITLDVYAASILEGTPTPHEHSALRWCAPEELSHLVWAPADVPAVAPVQAWLAAQRAAQGQGLGSSV